MRQIFADNDANGACGAAGGDPVAPADDEAGVFTEGAAREIVLAAAGGNERAEFRELEGAEKGVERSTDPDGDEQPGVGKDGGDAAGGADDADRDGIANGDGDAEADAEDLQEFPFVLAIGKRTGWRFGDLRRGGCGQSGISILDRMIGHHTFVGGKREEGLVSGDW